MSIPIDLSARVALVTGATGNLGGAMAKTLARAGADVAVHYLSNAVRAQALVEEIHAMGRKACLVQGSVSEKEHIGRMRDQIVAALGAVDILVLNAVSQVHPWRPLLQEDQARIQNQLDSCNLQTLHMCQAFVPAMCEQQWGRVIGISTECVMQMYPSQSAYVGAKRGMDGMLRVLAGEVGAQQVTVNQVAPGWINSDDSDDSGEGTQGYIRKNSLMGRRATDEDVANCVAFLASDLARSMTGGWIPVSCGSVFPRV